MLQFGANLMKFDQQIKYLARGAVRAGNYSLNFRLGPGITHTQLMLHEDITEFLEINHEPIHDNLMKMIISSKSDEKKAFGKNYEIKMLQCLF